MARPTIPLISALRTTAARLDGGASYKWSHFAQCNCGNLAQTITSLSPTEIYEAAFQRSGDWGEQAMEFCATSGYPIDYVIGKMLELGMSRDDVRHLERLSDPEVCRRIGWSLRHSSRDDVVAYMNTWADLLEERLASEDAAPLALAAE